MNYDCGKMEERESRKWCNKYIGFIADERTCDVCPLGGNMPRDNTPPSEPKRRTTLFPTCRYADYRGFSITRDGIKRRCINSVLLGYMAPSQCWECEYKDKD